MLNYELHFGAMFLPANPYFEVFVIYFPNIPFLGIHSNKVYLEQSIIFTLLYFIRVSYFM